MKWLIVLFGDECDGAPLMTDPAIWGIARWGHFEWGVVDILGKLWDNVLKIFERRGGSCNVLLWTLTLGSRDSETGHRAKSYASSTIKMIIVTKGARQLLLRTGTHVRLDAVGITDTIAKVGDEIQTGTVYYEVDAVKLRKITPGVVEFYECDLTELPLHD